MATLVLCTALAVLSLNMFLPSLPKIAAEFDADYALVNMSIAGYLAVTAVVQVIAGPLSDRFGRRPVMIGSMAVFAVASAGVALSQSIGAFLAWRMVQSVVVAGMTVPRAVVRDLFPQNEAASKLGYIAMAMALAPMLGPMLGGALDMVWGWRSGFWLYAVLGFGALLAVVVDLGETNTSPSATFGQQLREYPKLFNSRRFWGYALCVAFSLGGFYVFITGTPIVAEAWFDLSPAELGLGIGIITWGFFAGNFITGRFAQRVSLIRLIIWGRVSALVGPLIGLIGFVSGFGNLWLYFGAAVLVGFGNGLTIANANAGMMSVRPHLAGSASGLSGALSVAVGAVLTAMVGVMVNAMNGPFAVMGLIGLMSLCALVSAVYVWDVDRRCE